jgi:hypothetical protein
MGNTITKSADDKRFGDSLLAKEIKNIINNQTSTYKDKEIKIHVAKACCRGVVKPDIGLEQNNVVSIAFPKALDPKDTRCATQGICLDTTYVGYQIEGKTEDWCGNDKSNGLSGYNFSTIRGGGANSVCDNFMMDYCAKSLYEQGCIKIGKNKANALVPQFTNASENKMCWDIENKMNYGPPECYCLNSLFGPNLNTWPAKEIEDKTFGTKNPYGLEGRNTSIDNNFSKYTLNIFKADKTKQYPRVLDARCASRASSGDSGRSKAYTLAQDDNGNISICLNQINIADSNIGNANFDDIKQENNCGGPTSNIPTENSVPINPNQKISSDEKAAADKKIIDDAAAKKKAEDDALFAAKKKAEDDAKTRDIVLFAAKKKAEDDAKARDIVLFAAKKKAEDDALFAAKKKADDEAKIAIDNMMKSKADALVASKKSAEDDALFASKMKAEDDALFAAKKKADDEAKIAIDNMMKSKADALIASKKRTDDEAKIAIDNMVKAKADANAAITKASDDSLIISKKKADDEAKIAIDNMIKAKADADAAIIKAKNDTITKSESYIPTKANTDTNTNTTISNIQDNTDAKKKISEKSRVVMFYIGGSILLFVIIGIIIFLMIRKYRISDSD